MPTAPRQHRPFQHAAQQFRQAHDRRRGTAAARGYGTEWNAFSAAFRREHPICELEALGRIVGVSGAGTRKEPSGFTDHIVPVTGPDDEWFYDHRDLWALCAACNRWKTIAFDGGYGAAVKPAQRTLEGIERRRAEIVRAARERTGGRSTDLAPHA